MYDIVLTVLSILFCFSLICSLIFHGFLLSKSRRLLTNRLITSSTDQPVSIVKPLRGIDENLLINLETFFTMNFSTYELLFCVEDHDDPAIDIVKKLMQKYPQIDARLLTEWKRIGNNFKVNNVNQGYEKAKYNLVMFSDDKMFIQPKALEEMVNSMENDEKVGVVLQMPSSKWMRSGYSSNFNMESALFTHEVMITFFSQLMKQPTLGEGSSVLYRKEIFEKAGGLRFFANFSDEDLRIICFAKENGWKVRISTFRGLRNSEIMSFNDEVKRLRRWSQIKSPRTEILFGIFMMIADPRALSLKTIWLYYHSFGIQSEFSWLTCLYMLLGVLTVVTIRDFMLFVCISDGAKSEKLSLLNYLKFTYYDLKLLFASQLVIVLNLYQNIIRQRTGYEWKGRFIDST